MSRLTILDGLQAGSQIVLLKGTSKVGTSLDCAIVVADSVMQHDHFELVVGDMTALRVLRPLSLQDGKLLASGTELAVTGRLAFKAGATCFVVESETTGLSDPSSAEQLIWHQRFRKVAISLGSVVVVGAVGGVAVLWGSAQPPHTVVVSAVSGPHAVTQQANASSASDALKRRLIKVDLSDIIVTTQSDGAVLVSGELNEDRYTDWQSVRAWYDMRFGEKALMIERFVAPGLPPSLKIAAVWTGPDPYVVDDHGSRLHAGAKLGQGWLIDRIDHEHVMVRRGARILALRY